MGTFHERCFNPTLVRLRLPYPSPIFLPLRQFQSHAGSIEAVWSCWLYWPSSPVSIPRWFD